MANLNESLKDAVCIEDEVFFGPIADKERKIREHFENILITENKTTEPVVIENDASKNDSLYVSFSVDESKYESFDDSLSVEVDKMAQEKKHVTLRKNFDKLKSKRYGYYDSLEDVCSLVSNMDKCSISCEVDNSNVNNNQVPEDSLMINQPVIVHKNLVVSEQDSLRNQQGIGIVNNKSHGISEQIHFDDDSLAILEHENTFDDSLEDINVLSSVELEELDCIEDFMVENQNVIISVQQNNECMSRNLFDSSVQIIYEKKETRDSEESSDDKNILYDSLSNSDFKEVLKDSLEESEKCCEHLNFLKRVPDATTNSVKKSDIKVDTSAQFVCEKIGGSDTTDQEESSEDKNLLYDSLSNSDFKEVLKDSLEESEKCCEHLSFLKRTSDSTANHALKTESKLDSSVQIVCEKKGVSDNIDQEESSEDKNLLYDSLSNSDFKDVLKDSLEESEKCCEHLNFLKQNSGETTNNILESEKKVESQNIFDTSVQIVYEKLQNSYHTGSISEVTNSENNEISKDSLENSKNSNKIPIQGVDDEPKVTSEIHFGYQSSKISQNSDKLLTNASEKTLIKDSKCQIPPENMKILSALEMQLEKEANNSFTPIPVPCNSVVEIKEGKDTVDRLNSKLPINVKESDMIGNNILHDSITGRKSEPIDSANITQREKSSAFQFAKNSNEENNLSDISLLQALDLHDTSILNESVIQSNNSLLPLNLCCRDQDIFMPVSREDIKENIPRPLLKRKKGFCTSSKKTSPTKLSESKTPKHVQKTASLKDSIKKTSGTKIPVRKVEKFVVPTAAPSKFPKQVPATFSAEKVKKCQHPHSPYSPKIETKTPKTTPNKTPHFCKVRNTIFSKVPQIVPSKKYMNIQSPVAQYIKNNGPGKTTQFDAVLRDCMNRPLESPLHSHHTPKSGTLKSTKK